MRAKRLKRVWIFLKIYSQSLARFQPQCSENSFVLESSAQVKLLFGVDIE